MAHRFAGNGNTGIGYTGNGYAGSGNTGIGYTGNGYAGNGYAGNGYAENRYAGNGYPGSGFARNDFKGTGVPEESRLNAETVIEVETERLKSFKGHPFKVHMDRQMVQLQDSIEQFGILIPLIVRPVADGFYEIISGHRRRYIADQLGYRKLPVIIRVLSDEDAVIAMVDSNVQREVISPSEKAFAYKMKNEALKKMRENRFRSQIDYNYPRKKSIDIISEETKDSAKQVQRYLKLTELIPELLEKLDDGILSFTPAYEIAFLSQEEQREFLDAMEYTQSLPSLSQAQRIKKLSKEGTLDQQQMREILSEIKKGDITRVIFKNEQLYKYFPKSYSPERMKREILEILKTYMEQHWEYEE